MLDEPSIASSAAFIHGFAGVLLADDDVRARVLEALGQASGETLETWIHAARESLPFGATEWAAVNALFMRRNG